MTTVENVHIGQDICRVLHNVWFTTAVSNLTGYVSLIGKNVPIGRLQLFLEMIKCVTREYWIQRITFAAETNVAYSCGLADTHTHTRAHLYTFSAG